MIENNEKEAQKLKKISEIYRTQAGNEGNAARKEFLLKLSDVAKFVKNNFEKIQNHQLIDEDGEIINNMPFANKAIQYYENNIEECKNQFQNSNGDHFIDNSKENEIKEYIQSFSTFVNLIWNGEPSLNCPTEFLAYILESEVKRWTFGKYASCRNQASHEKSVQYALSLQDLGIDYMYDKQWETLKNSLHMLHEDQIILFDSQQKHNYNYVICAQLEEASKYLYDANVNQYMNLLISKLKENITENKNSLNYYKNDLKTHVERTIAFCKPKLAKFQQEDYSITNAILQLNTLLTNNQVSERDIKMIAFYTCKDLTRKGQLASVANLDINMIENQSETLRTLMNKIQKIAQKETQATGFGKIVIDVEDFFLTILYAIKYYMKNEKEKMNIKQTTKWGGFYLNASQGNAQINLN